MKISAKPSAAGINIIHVNTELRVAWRRGLEEGLCKEPYEVVPYKILPFAVQSVEEEPGGYGSARFSTLRATRPT